jgi:S-DNA-T family DNA segregation ATPase FtsK/SpoIIIE
MAKKKKNSKKKTQQVTSSSPFWAYSWAIILFLLAFFILLGGFKTGGVLPVDLFKASYWLFGAIAYVLPVFLIYSGVYKFKTEDHRIPLPNLISTFVAVFFLSATSFSAFVTKNQFHNYIGGYGGHSGQFIGTVFLSFLDTIPATILFIIISILAIFFAFGISPSVFVTLYNYLKEHKTTKSELEELQARSSQAGFKLNEGVPVEHHNKAQEADSNLSTKLSSFKNSAQNLTKAENHLALTTANDPDWKFPSIGLLNQKQDRADAGDVNSNARIIHDTFSNFKINVEMEGANIGPRVTQYTLKPPANVKLTKITALENNLALDLAAHSIRMEAPIPGKRAVGIEVPNVKAATVRISSILTSKEWSESDKPLSFTIGKDISGKPVVADLAAMPHLLIAGQTGSGKSVMINTLLTSLLYRNSPSDMKLILVDPKQVEMGVYNDLPHLLAPVINEPEKCISALKWAVAEMNRRLKTMAEVGKRNIVEYNSQNETQGMPYIVIIIDELADLMMMAARDVEALVVRLAQKARAAGIHLVLATQRPSVDVITGLIKANVPARIAFTVASQVDSRTIIDQIGAEKLLGQGDMLFTNSDMPKPKRIQAAFIDNNEATKVTDFIRSQRPPEYDDEVVSQPVQIGGKNGFSSGGDFNDMGGDDSLFKDAVKVVIDNQKASTSLLQRRLRIGYGRAARLIETMEEQGIISSAQGSRPRDVLVSSTDEVFNVKPLDDDDANEELIDDNPGY